MQRAPPGSMISVLVSEKEIHRYLKPFNEVSVAAVNGRSVSVVSGPCKAIADLQRHLEAQGVPCKHLVTSHAFHSAMMDGILDDFGNGSPAHRAEGASHTLSLQCLWNLDFCCQGDEPRLLG